MSIQGYGILCLDNRDPPYISTQGRTKQRISCYIVFAPKACHLQYPFHSPLYIIYDTPTLQEWSQFRTIRNPMVCSNTHLQSLLPTPITDINTHFAWSIARIAIPSLAIGTRMEFTKSPVPIALMLDTDNVRVYEFLQRTGISTYI